MIGVEDATRKGLAGGRTGAISRIIRNDKHATEIYTQSSVGSLRRVYTHTHTFLAGWRVGTLTRTTRSHTHAYTHVAHAHTHARTHAHTHTHTHLYKTVPYTHLTLPKIHTV